MSVIHKADKPDKTAALEKEIQRVSKESEVLAQQLTDAQIALCELYESVVMANG